MRLSQLSRDNRRWSTNTASRHPERRQSISISQFWPLPDQHPPAHLLAMSWLHTVNIVIHVTCGTAALGVGLVALWFNKRPATHRRWGRWFLRLLVVVIVTAALGAIGFKPRPFLIILTALAAYQGFSGYRVVRRREQRALPFDRWLAVVVLVCGIGYSALLPRSGVNWSPAVIYSTLGGLVLVAGYDTAKAFWLHERLKTGWLYEHIYKVLGALNALASAFAGNVLTAYQPYSQLGPTLLFLLLVLYFIVQRHRQQRVQTLIGPASPTVV